MELLIRQAEPGDFEAIRNVHAGPKAQAGTLQLPYPSADMWRKRLADPAPENHALVAIEAGLIIGHVGLDLCQRRRRSHVAMMGMAVLDQRQGQGIGSALMQAILAQADNWLNILRIELTVYTDNAAALRLYQKFGFVIEGTHRAFALRDGVYVDAHAMARLHPNPPKI